MIGNGGSPTKQRESPAKEKYKRMFDKLLEYEHENDKLQQVLEELCTDKVELESGLTETR